MIEFEPVTLSEAQFLLGRSQDEINRAIDRGEVDKITEQVLVPAPARKTGRRPSAKGGRRGQAAPLISSHAPPAMVRKTIRKLGPPELLFLALERDVHADLSPSGRKRLYQAIKAQAPNARVVSFGPFEANIARAAKVLATRYEDLATLRSGIVEQTDGDAVIKGTGISVHRIAALAGGQTMNEILADYPDLTEQQVRRSIDYTEAYPKIGRPYPTRSFKRAAGALADMGIFDLPEGNGAEARA